MLSRFLKQILLISVFELNRLFLTRKGHLYLLTFVLVWYFILFYPIRYAADLLAKEQTHAKGYGFFEFLGFGSLLHWRIPEFAVFWHFALLFFPLLCVFITADQTGSDRERGTLRFLGLRTSRDCIFFGRFTGMMLVQAILVCVVSSATLILVLYRNMNLFPVGLENLLAISLNLFLVLLPFTAMMAALSAKVDSARQCTVWAVLIWTLLSGIISGLSYYLPGLEFLKTMVPGFQLSELAQLAEWKTLQLAYIPLLQTCVLLIFGRWIMTRQTL